MVSRHLPLLPAYFPLFSLADIVLRSIYLESWRWEWRRSRVVSIPVKTWGTHHWTRSPPTPSPDQNHCCSLAFPPQSPQTVQCSKTLLWGKRTIPNASKTRRGKWSYDVNMCAAACRESKTTFSSIKRSRCWNAEAVFRLQSTLLIPLGRVRQGN